LSQNGLGLGAEGVQFLLLPANCGIIIPHDGRIGVMRFDSIIWDLDDDPGGDVKHCGEHGVTKEEVESVSS
jgi:hypothetical protein